MMKTKITPLYERLSRNDGVDSANGDGDFTPFRNISKTPQSRFSVCAVPYCAGTQSRNPYSRANRRTAPLFHPSDKS